MKMTHVKSRNSRRQKEGPKLIIKKKNQQKTLNRKSKIVIRTPELTIWNKKVDTYTTKLYACQDFVLSLTKFQVGIAHLTLNMNENDVTLITENAISTYIHVCLNKRNRDRSTTNFSSNAFER